MLYYIVVYVVIASRLFVKLCYVVPLKTFVLLSSF